MSHGPGDMLGTVLKNTPESRVWGFWEEAVQFLPQGIYNSVLFCAALYSHVTCTILFHPFLVIFDMCLSFPCVAVVDTPKSASTPSGTSCKMNSLEIKCDVVGCHLSVSAYYNNSCTIKKSRKLKRWRSYLFWS